jgi:hypothetical protein
MSHQIEIHVMMTDSGEYVVAKDEETVSELAELELDEDEAQRHVKLKIKLSPPNAEEVASEVFEINID